VWTYWLIAVGLEVLLGGLFLVSGAEASIERGLEAAGIEFNTDLLTAGRVLIAYPAAAVGVVLALGQVAAPDLAVVAIARLRSARGVLRAVRTRFRPWSPDVGARRGLLIWAVVVAVFTGCNLASGVLHAELVPDSFEWSWSWTVLAMVPVAMFDAGALLEENGWRGFVLPTLLRTRGPLVASIVVGVAWAAWHFPVKFDAFLEYGVGGAVAYLTAFTVKLVAVSVVMTWFWAQAGQTTLLAIAMHGLSNDAARVGGVVDGATWQVAAVSELDLAAPYLVVAVVVVLLARRRGWGDLTGLGREETGATETVSP
jgi:membrane protease YdiL (CAAX protease family)